MISVEIALPRISSVASMKMSFIRPRHFCPCLLSQLWNNRILRRKYLSLWGPRYKGIQEDLKTVKTDRSLKWQRFAPHVLARIIPELSDEVKRNGYEIPAKTAQAVESQQHGLNLMTGTAGD
jgi:hypothetical protein